MAHTASGTRLFEHVEHRGDALARAANAKSNDESENQRGAHVLIPLGPEGEVISFQEDALFTKEARNPKSVVAGLREIPRPERVPAKVGNWGALRDEGFGARGHVDEERGNARVQELHNSEVDDNGCMLCRKRILAAELDQTVHCGCDREIQYHDNERDKTLKQWHHFARKECHKQLQAGF